MASVTKRLAKGSVSTTSTSVYTVPAGTTTIIKAITVCNSGASDQNLSMTIAGTAIIWNYKIKAYDTIAIPFLDHILQAGETITLFSTGTNTTYYISGKEVT